MIGRNGATNRTLDLVSCSSLKREVEDKKLTQLTFKTFNYSQSQAGKPQIYPVT